MKICNATGNGICVNCNYTPPMINGYSCGDICRNTVQNIIDEITEDSRVVVYDNVTKKFYSSEYYDSDEYDWIEIE